MPNWLGRRGGHLEGWPARRCPGRVTPGHRLPAIRASALLDLLLRDGDGTAPPALVAGERDVLPRHPLGRVVAVADREEAMIAGREMGRMLLPGRPLLVCRTPS